MPHARIDMHRTLAPKMPDMSAAILRGMVTGFGMPADDFFQAFRLHDEGELFYSPTFPNQQRDDIIFIELVASKGYSDKQKQTPWKPSSTKSRRSASNATTCSW